MERALRNRLTFGPLMLAGLFLLLWLDHTAQRMTIDHAGRELPPGVGIAGIGLLVLLVMFLPLAVVELSMLFTAEHVRPYRAIAALGCGALVLHAFCTQFERFKHVAASVMAFIIVFVMLASAFRRAWSRDASQAIVRMAGTVLATLYLGGLAWFLMAIRVKQSATGYFHFHGSTGKLLFILIVVKSTDIGAYFGGRALGRHKLIPWLSPGKTWEGLFCGMIFSGLVGAISAKWIDDFVWQKAMIFGFILGGIGQLGDLLESLFKRDAEVKDSGKIIPGFGGVLDVIDSPLFAAPFAYLLFSFF